MNSQSKSIMMMMVVLTIGSLSAGCEHQLRAGASHDVPRTHRIADNSHGVDQPSSVASIIRESVDPRCFGPSPEDNTEVIACPKMAQLATPAASAHAGPDQDRFIHRSGPAMARR